MNTLLPMKIFTSRATKFFLFIFLLTSGLFIGQEKVEASSATWTYSKTTFVGTITTVGSFSASTNKNSYTPGETITVTLSATDLGGGSCAVLSWNCTSKKGMRITATLGTQSVTNNQTADWAVARTLTAPSTPGTYTIGLDGGWYDTSAFTAASSMSITVAAPSLLRYHTVYYSYIL